MKKAIIQCADTGPLESIVVMLRSVGYECCLPTEELKAHLRSIGCDTVLNIQDLVNHWGYPQPMHLRNASSQEMESADLYVDIKAHRCYDKVVRRWPNLAGKVLWYRINGGKPEHVVNARGDHGDEVNPPCPVLTPNQWYKDALCTDPMNPKYGAPTPWAGRAYTCWPVFCRFNDYYTTHGRP